ncbi:uncharacterized [Tachysurus ichikawai]
MLGSFLCQTPPVLSPQYFSPRKVPPRQAACHSCGDEDRLPWALPLQILPIACLQQEEGPRKDQRDGAKGKSSCLQKPHKKGRKSISKHGDAY